MPEFLFAIPGDLTTPTGGYRYARRIIDELKQFGWKATLLALPGDFPSPSAKSLRETERLLDKTPDDALILFDGLAYGALPTDLLDNVPRRYVALVHHPLALETGLTAERVAEFKTLERESLARAMRVVAVSQSTADILARDFGVPKDRITVAVPGTEPVKRARGNAGAPRLLGVGAVTPRKGFDVLTTALSQIKDIEWECHIVGSLDRDKEAAAQLKGQIAEEKLEDRIKLLGPISDEELAAEYDQATLFVLPSHFEGYGMAFAEAIAYGLPVVACSGGAVTKTVPQDAGVFVPPGNASALAEKLRWLLSNPGEIKKRADEAWYRSEKLPRWRDTAREVAMTLEKALA